MSAYNKPMLQIGLSEHLVQVSLNPSKKKYAFRIGFVGNNINRFDKNLLGKTLTSKEFETVSVPNDICHTATRMAKDLLRIPLSEDYPVERQRLVLAKTSGIENAEREKSLISAVNWLKTKNVDVIYFQYQWMVTPQMKQLLGLCDYPKEKLVLFELR